MTFRRQNGKKSVGSRTWIYVPLILYEVGGIFMLHLYQMEEHSTFNRVAMGPRSTLRSGPHWTIAPHMEHDRLDIEF